MTEVSISLVTGAWLAAMAGAVTGALDVRLRSAPSGMSAVARALAGAAIAAFAYAAFVVVGMVLSLLTFSGAPDAWPALLSVIIGCVALLLVRMLHAALAPRFGMPERRAPSARPTLEEFIAAQGDDPAIASALGRLKAAPTSVSRAPSERRTVADLIDAQPCGGSPTMWLAGVGLALLPLVYGISCIVTRRGELGTTLWRSEVQGGPAIALGVGWIGVGLFLHFHFFFGLHSRLAAFSRRAKSVALVMALAGLGVAGTWSVFAQLPPF
jgi:hypothetical protein